MPTKDLPQSGPVRFPPAWLWWVDEAVPAWVKNHYSPKESWKGKPFSKEDAQFFFRGIEELSETFTEARPERVPRYFQHPKYRSSYLLYFLPLQASKFLALYQLQPRAFQAALDHGKQTGTLRILDLGAGPGTASLAFLLALTAAAEKPPAIELVWYDSNADIMADGKALVEVLSTSFPKLRDRVKVITHTEPWWNAVNDPSDFSLTLLGNVLNEGTSLTDSSLRSFARLTEKAKGGGILFVEPAAKPSSQLLSQIRDRLLEAERIAASPTSIWGPCLHAGKCPMAEGRDWCHFSVPVEIPGKWFKSFSKMLSSERQWAKFSYLWLAATENPAPLPAEDLRRVISDPLQKNGAEIPVLICEPEIPAKFFVPGNKPVYRGDLVSMIAPLKVKKPEKRWTKPRR